MSKQQLIIFSGLCVFCILAAKFFIVGPDPLIDFGEGLYIAWQLSEGQVLYKDIFYVYGPLSIYLYALWFHLFGLGIYSIAVFNFLSTILILFGLFYIFTRISSDFTATFACVIFVLLFAFPPLTFYTNYNYIFPYTPETIHGVLFSLFAIVFFARFQQYSHLGNILMSGLAVGLAFLTKIEISIAISCALAVGLTLLLWSACPDNSRRLKIIAVFFTATLIPIIFAWLLLGLNSLKWNEAFHGIAGAWFWLLQKDLSSLGFYKYWMGAYNAAHHLKLIGVLSIIYISYFAIAAALDYAVGKYVKRWLWAAIPLLTVVVVLLLTYRKLIYLDILSPFPILMALLTITILIHFIRTKDPSSLLKLAFIVFAYALLLKMGIRPRIYNYGFVLGMPATLIVVAALLDWIPKFLVKHHGNGSVFRLLSAALIICIFIVPTINISRFVAKMKPYVVYEGEDQIRSDTRGLLIEDLLEYLSNHAEPGDTLMVAPAGTMINYLSRMENPTPYTAINPLLCDLVTPGKILKDIKKEPPDYFVIPLIDMREHGVERFGRGYAEEILRWVRTHYKEVALFGHNPLYAPPQKDGLLLLKHARI